MCPVDVIRQSFVWRCDRNTATTHGSEFKMHFLVAFSYVL